MSCTTTGGIGDSHTGPEAETCPSKPPIPEALGLLDMPAHWLDQLVQLGVQHHQSQSLFSSPQPQHHPTLIALFRTCRSLRDRVLLQRTCVVGFSLPLEPPDEAAAAQAKLLLACQRSPHIKLKLSLNRQPPVQQRTAAHINASAANLMGGTMMAAGGGLTAIKNVELQGLQLGALVPHWLTSTCPQMTSLTLCQCPMSEGLHPPPTPTPPCSQLQNLTLHDTTVADSPAAMNWWQQQLRALTGLNSLTCQRMVGREAPRCLESASAIGTQITKLRLLFPSALHFNVMAASVNMWFPNLRELELQSVKVDDVGMEALLGMQHLTSLTCLVGFSLQHSYSHHPCSWTHLTIGDLDIDSFDRLPLGGLQSLLVRGDSLRIKVWPDALDGMNAAASRVAGVITRLGGVTCEEREGLGLAVSVDSESNRGSSAVVAVLPIVAACKPTHFAVCNMLFNPGMNPDLLAAIKQHLSCATIKSISFVDVCFAPEVWPLLLPSLPAGAKLVLENNRLFEAQVTEMCVHACRPVKVVLKRGRRMYIGDDEGQMRVVLQDGWEQRVRAAMAAAGHQHVELLSSKGGAVPEQLGGAAVQDQGFVSAKVYWFGRLQRPR